MTRLIEPETCDRRGLSRPDRIHAPALDVRVRRLAGARNENEFDPRPTVHDDDPIGTGVLRNAQPTKKWPSVARLLG